MVHNTIGNNSDQDNLSTFVVNLSSKEELRKQLNNQVELFLKSGGSISELPPNYTNFKDGKLPVATRVYTQNKTKPLAPIKPEAQKPSTTVQKSNNQKYEPIKPVQAKKVSGKRKTKPKPKNVSDEALRKKNITEQRILAEANGVDHFIAVCKRHGQTQYRICTNGTRCLLCVDEARIKRIERNPKVLKRKQENKERVAFNKNALHEALSVGKSTFIGLCINCGRTEFKIRMVTRLDNNAIPHKVYHPICIVCHKKHMKSSDEKRRNKAKKGGDNPPCTSFI